MKNDVWQLIDSSTVGGIETHVAHLSRELQSMGIANQIVRIKSYGAHPVFDQELNNDLNIYCCDGISDVISRCRRERPAIIHAHGSKACLIAKYLRLFANQKIVCTYHTGETGVGLQGVYDRVNQYSAFIGQAIAVSDPIAKKLIGNRLRIDNFIPVPESIHVSEKKQIAFVGRLSHEKGPDRFVELSQLRPDLNFAMYGDGPMLDKLKRVAPDNLSFYSNVNNMDNHWQDIDLLCITSREEGLPLVALEAMARGVCIVSVPVGGLPKLIDHEQNGFLLETQSVVAFNSFLQRYAILDQEDKTQIQNHARKCIQEQYSSQSLVPKIKRLYDLTCEGKL